MCHVIYYNRRLCLIRLDKYICDAWALEVASGLKIYNIWCHEVGGSMEVNGH